MKAGLLAATAALMFCAGTASADLVGTNVVFELNHPDTPVPGLFFLSGVHEYGTSEMFSTQFTGSITMSSPDGAATTDNSIEIDFAAFASGYTAFPGQTGVLTISALAEDVQPGSVDLLIGGSSMAANINELTNGFIATWNADDVSNAGPPPSITVVWNSVPAPGALALLGLAGTMTRRGRRRN